MTDPQSGRLTVATAGTPERLSDEPMIVARLDIFALDANTDRVYLGDSAVSAQAGYQQGLPLSAKEQAWFENVDLSQVWLDATVSGEGVTWIARQGAATFTTSL